MAYFCRILKFILITLGTIASVIVILAFTSAPFWIWYNFSSKHAGINRSPDCIIVLGGGGMPSETGLMRCWYTTKVADRFPEAKVIIALPGDTTDSLSSVRGMKKELIIRGIGSERILFENSGTNTRAQAVYILKNITNYGLRITNQLSIVNCQLSILIVTSPEHLTRAVLTFKKAGFLKVDGLPAFEEAIEGDITYKGKKLGGREWIPDIGDNISIRYEFWTQLRYEEVVIREYLAIIYYKLKGWI